MKRICAICLVFGVFFMGLCAMPVHAGIIGEVITTDIVAYIDEQPIPSYNINDYTYVIAEDLAHYGFDVYWRAAERRLEIYEKGGELPCCYPDAEKINQRKDAVKKGQHAFDVYETDIVTTLNNEPVNAYNVDGQTLIQVDELSRFAYFSYDDSRREVKIDKARYYADWLFSLAAQETYEIPGKHATYTGSIDKSIYESTGEIVPHGLGKLTEFVESTEGLQYTVQIETIAKFENGTPYDAEMEFTYQKKTPYNGTDKRVRETYLFEGGMGKSAGMCYSVTYFDDGTCERTEERYSGSVLTYKRESCYDPAYVYGYRIEKEGNVNALGQYVDYHETAVGKISYVEASAFSSFIADENGKLFVTGYHDGSAHLVPMYVQEGVKAAAGDFILLQNGVLINTEGTWIDEGVLTVTERLYLKENGELKSDKGDIISENVSELSADGGLVLYRTENGNVYYLRLNFEEEGSKWNDGYDLSAPVLVFEGAKSVSRGNRFLVVDEDGTLWGWSSYWYKTPYQDNSGNLFTCKTPIKIAENVAFADSGTGFIAYVTNDGLLYVMPDVTEPKNKAIFDIAEPTYLLEKVTQISAGGSYLMAIDGDGVLYAWGENKEGRLGTGDKGHAQQPTLIMQYYEK